MLCFWSDELQKYKTLPDVDTTTQVAIQAYARGEKPSTKLRFMTWSILIPHLKKAKQGKGLTQNLALLKLQKTMVTKVATDALHKTATSTMDAEVKVLDEKEKLSSPPRRGWELHAEGCWGHGLIVVPTTLIYACAFYLSFTLQLLSIQSFKY